MSSIHVTTTVPPYDPGAGHVYGDFERFLQSVDSDKFHKHSVTSDPATADIILFIGSQRPDLRDVRRHPLVKDFREKCFIFHMGDRIVPRLPGIYTCLEKQWHHQYRTRSGAYTQVYEYEYINGEPLDRETKYLYTFVGSSATHPVRKRLLKIRDRRGLIVDTSAPNHCRLPKRGYAKTLLDGKFVLCPRGLGASSFRVFECLKAARIPIIISDDWVLPGGPHWESFSLRVSERDVEQIPTIVREAEPFAADMSRNAWEVYRDWFSREATYHQVTEWCLDIMNTRKIPESMLRHVVTLRTLKPSHLATNIARRLNFLGVSR